MTVKIKNSERPAQRKFSPLKSLKLEIGGCFRAFFLHYTKESPFFVVRTATALIIKIVNKDFLSFKHFI